MKPRTAVALAALVVAGVVVASGFSRTIHAQALPKQAVV